MAHVGEELAFRQARRLGRFLRAAQLFFGALAFCDVACRHTNGFRLAMVSGDGSDSSQKPAILGTKWDSIFGAFTLLCTQHPSKNLHQWTHDIFGNKLGSSPADQLFLQAHQQRVIRGPHILVDAIAIKLEYEFIDGAYESIEPRDTFSRFLLGASTLGNHRSH